MKRPTPLRTKLAAKRIGESVSVWRKLRGLTMQQLAEKANASRSTVSRLENGDPSVSFETTLNVAVALGIVDRGIDHLFLRRIVDRPWDERLRHRSFFAVDPVPSAQTGSSGGVSRCLARSLGSHAYRTR